MSLYVCRGRFSQKEGRKQLYRGRSSKSVTATRQADSGLNRPDGDPAHEGESRPESKGEGERGKNKATGGAGAEKEGRRGEVAASRRGKVQVPGREKETFQRGAIKEGS